MLALEDEWVWDSWYLHDGQQWHCWFLKAPKSLGNPDLRHWNVTHGHATSADLKAWTYHGTTFWPSKPASFDDYTTWTGCTLKGDDGKWHYFYTGTSRAENGKIQRIGHAIGNDLDSWERVGDGLCLDIFGEAASYYERDWQRRWHNRSTRDPWVMKDPHDNGWLMYFTARSSHTNESNDAGCIGFAKSPDLYRWTLHPPVFAGGWGELEVPQVFTHNGKWYCLFCMSTWHQAEWNKALNGESGRGNHYLIADHPYGPWKLPSGPAMDVQKDRYAARIIDANGLKILGFKDGEPHSFGGVIMDPEPVFTDSQNRLYVGNIES